MTVILDITIEKTRNM